MTKVIVTPVSGTETVRNFLKTVGLPQEFIGKIKKRDDPISKKYAKKIDTQLKNKNKVQIDDEEFIKSELDKYSKLLNQPTTYNEQEVNRLIFWGFTPDYPSKKYKLKKGDYVFFKAPKDIGIIASARIRFTLGESDFSIGNMISERIWKSGRVFPRIAFFDEVSFFPNFNWAQIKKIVHDNQKYSNDTVQGSYIIHNLDPNEPEEYLNNKAIKKNMYETYSDDNFVDAKIHSDDEDKKKYEINSDSTVEDILLNKNGIRYSLPAFQRGYSWEPDDQIEKFWDESILGAESNPFLGTFIRRSIDNNQSYEIIDGQQRLTTITIFGALIRNLFLETEVEDDEETVNKHARNTNTTFVQGENPSTLKEHYKFIPAKKNMEFFKKLIQDETTSRTEIDILDSKKPKELQITLDNSFKRRVYGAYKALEYKIKQTNNFNEDPIAFLNEIRMKIAKMRMITFDVYEDLQAIQIFQQVNARGSKLTTSDLIKSLLFEKVVNKEKKQATREDLINDIDNKWSEMIDNIENEGEDGGLAPNFGENEILLNRFIRYSFISKYEFCTEKKLYLILSSYISEKRLDSLEFLEFLKDSSASLKIIASDHTSTRDLKKDLPNVKNHYELNESFILLKTMRKHIQSYSFLISLYRNLKELSDDISVPIKIIKYLAFFIFLYNGVHTKPTNKLEKSFSVWGRELDNLINDDKSQSAFSNLFENKIIMDGKADGIKEALKKLLEELKDSEDLYNKDIFYEKLNYKDNYALCRFVLILINSESADKETIDRIPREINVEHFMPQSDKNWKQFLPDYTKEQYEENINKIGNLFMVSQKMNKNELSNHEPEKKLEILSESTFVDTKNVAHSLMKEADKNGIDPNMMWTFKKIEERTHDIVNKLITKINEVLDVDIK